MGSDRARTTYNEKRQYRRVVHQQGRVSLEADLNEAQEILAETTRRQVIEIVGPMGVPAGSDGYAIGVVAEATAKAPRDLTIGQGVFYLGGLRVYQGVGDLRYTTQSEHDWVEGPTPAPDADGDSELVYLRLREQEVSAVEDVTLLDPALGGPDTAQRVRLVARVGRYGHANPKEGPTVAFHELKKHWASRGITVDPVDMRLRRSARLQVSFAPAYQGPDNQMVRIQIATPADSGEAPSQIVWAYDDASALYRVDAISGTSHKTLKIVPAPVDAAHQPKVGQVIEILFAAASLGGDDYAAETCGFVTTVTGAYDAGAGTIVVEDLPFEEGCGPKALFVRPWESLQTFTPGTPLSLVDGVGNDTGLAVTLTSTRDAPAIAGDYWSFAVRPATPTILYPGRYFAPQPPDGPREWACPLALIDWTCSRPIDCRPSFGTLTETSHEGGCCTLTLGREDLKGRPMQEWLDAAARDGRRSGGTTVCLRPGRYEIDRPLRLRKEHSDLTLEACGPGVEIVAAEHAEASFAQGLVELHHAERVALRGLRFVIPEVPFPREVARDLSRLEPTKADSHDFFRLLASMHVASGLRLVATQDITVEDCTFTFQRRPGRPAFGGAIVASGDVTGLDVNRCVFQTQAAPKDEQLHLLFGYLQVPPAVQVEVVLAHAGAGRVVEIFTHPVRDGFSTSLNEASFRRNTFAGLTAAGLALSQIGHLRLEDNEVRHSYAGFWLLTLNSGAFEPEGVGEHDEILATVLRDVTLHWSVALARCLDFSTQPQPRDNGPLTLDLHVRGNTVHVTGSAFVCWHSGKDDKASAVVSANHLTNTAPLIPTGLMAQVHTSTLTGNVLVHRAQSAERSAPAFVVSHGKTQCLFAVAGNALVGEMHLPREGLLREIVAAIRGERR